MPEMFSKSRAQEFRINIDNLASQVEEMDKRLSDMKIELRERCPHPDDHVRRLDTFRSTPHSKTRTELWYCDLCHATITRKGN